jgi:hypothetical protein
VRLILCVRKFFCRTPSCVRRIFTERLPEVVAPYSRTTERLTVLLRAIAFALGGEAGDRLAKRIGVSTSPATLISLIRRTPLPNPPAARILGVDDWAHRKGRSYGTAIVDLERHRLIELLPDREAETLSRWLVSNPGIEVISRDRSETYATGARQGAPDATQVVDRWHLLHNWREAVERVFDRHRGRIKRIVLPVPEPVGKLAATVLPAKSVNRRASTSKSNVPAHKPRGSPGTGRSEEDTPKASTSQPSHETSRSTTRRPANMPSPTSARRASLTRNVGGCWNPTSRT